MAFVDGAKMRFKVDEKEIFHEVSAEITGSTDYKEVATKDTNNFTEYTASKKNFSGSANGKMSKDTTTQQDVAAMLGYWKDDTVLDATMTDGEVGSLLLSGSITISDFTITADNEDFVAFSYNLRGTGELNIGVVAA